MKRKNDYFTLYDKVGIDVDIYSIINNINSFSVDALRLLKDAVDDELNVSVDKNTITPSTLEDEYKIQILKEFFNKFTWTDLEEIKKKIL